MSFLPPDDIETFLSSIDTPPEIEFILDYLKKKKHLFVVGPITPRLYFLLRYGPISLPIPICIKPHPIT